MAKVDDFKYQIEDLKTKEKKLNDSLKEATNLLNEKEKTLSEIGANHKKIEGKLYKEIAKVED